MRYLAIHDSNSIIIFTNEQRDHYFDLGFDIAIEDDNGDRRIIGTHGEWIEPKPNVEEQSEYIPANVNKQIRQMKADLDYISMMTGVSL